MNWKIAFLIFHVVFILNCLIGKSDNLSKEKPRILILMNNGIVRNLLQESNLFEVITPDDQQKALSKLKDCGTTDCGMELGKTLFAKFILQGILTDSTLTFRISNVNKGTYTASAQKLFEAADQWKQTKPTISDVLDNFEKSMKYESKKKTRILISNCMVTEQKKGVKLESLEKKYNKVASFTSNFLKNEFISNQSLEVIDEYVIEKAMKQITLKQACGMEDCEVQLAKILFAEYILSCNLVSNLYFYLPIEANIKLYDLKKSKYIKYSKLNLASKEVNESEFNDYSKTEKENKDIIQNLMEDIEEK